MKPKHQIIAFLIAILGFQTAAFAQSHYLIPFKMVKGKYTYAIVSSKGKITKTLDSIANIDTKNGCTSFINMETDKTCFLNEKGSVVSVQTAEKVDLYGFGDGYAVLHKDEDGRPFSAVMDSTGKIVLPFTEAYLEPYSDGWCSYYRQSNGEKGYINLKNETMILKNIDHQYSFSDGKAHIHDTTYKFYYIDTKGKPLFNKRYESATYFLGGYAVVRESETAPYILIDANGKTAYTFDKTMQTEAFSMGNGWVCLSKPIDDTDAPAIQNVLNPNSTIEYTLPKSTARFSEGLLATQKGYIDHKGSLIIDMKGEDYTEEQEFHKGHAVISKYDPKNGIVKHYYLIDKTGKVVWKSEGME